MVMQSSIYKFDYEGCDGMRNFDARSDLRRWFENYLVDGDAKEFADDYEWLTIEAKKFRGARRSAVRYIGTIGDDEGQRPRRTAVFETNAPPPPTFHLPAKYKPEPRAARSRDSGTTTIDTLYEAMNKVRQIVGPEAYAKMMRSDAARDPWSLYTRTILAEQRHKMELERVTLSTMNWLVPLYRGAVVTGLDLASGLDMTTAALVTPLPPPKRYRRNAK